MDTIGTKFISMVFLIYLLVSLGIDIAGMARPISFIDEAFVASMVLGALLNSIMRMKIPSNAVFPIVATILILAIGSLGLHYSNVIPDEFRLRLIVTSAIIDLKIFILATSLIILLDGAPEIAVDNLAIKVARFFALLGFLNIPFLALDLVRGINIHGVPLGIRAGGFIPMGYFDVKFESAYLAMASFVCSLFLTSQSKWKSFYSSLTVIQLIALISIASIKEFGGAVLALVLFLILRSGINGRTLILLSASVIFYGVLTTENRISESFADRFITFLGEVPFDTVRTRMYEVAPQIAHQNFPFGSGWGTFGSSASRDIFYSPLYFEYGISHLHGGSPSSGELLICTQN